MYILLPGVDGGLQSASTAHFGAFGGGNDNDAAPTTLGLEGVEHFLFWSLLL